MKTLIRGSVLAAVVLFGAPMAWAITVDGNLSDWGVTIPNATNTTASPTAWIPLNSGILYWDDQIGSNGYVSPGYGGQDYDLEAMYFHYDATQGTHGTAYFAMVTGTDPDGEVNTGAYSSTYPNFYWGDLFFDFGIDSTVTPPASGENSWNITSASFDTAIDITNYLDANTVGQGNTVSGIPADVYTGSGTWWSPVAFSQHGGTLSPYRINGGTDSGIDASIAFRDAVSDPGTTNDALDHNVLEVSFALTQQQLDAWSTGGGILIHWTQQCGNDVGNWVIPTTPPDVPEVPEPATWALLTLGVAAGIVRRRVARVH